MKILLTGANGYIGKRLLPVLLEAGHEVVCCVRDKHRFDISRYTGRLSVCEVSFLKPNSLHALPTDIDVAYYLIHSMSTSIHSFDEMEAESAYHFVQYANSTTAKQLVYLSGIVNQKVLSRHLRSRFRVEQILQSSTVPLTALRAGIIVGSGSASFEIIRDLVEKLPFMVAPRWLNTRCQPIAIRNVIDILTRVLQHPDCMAHSFDIGGAEVFPYKEMLLQYAAVRKLRRKIITLPFISPRFSSYWLFFITSTTYKLAVNLVDSMRVDVVCNTNPLPEMLGIEMLTYKEAIEKAFDKIEQNMVLSSWKDAMITTSDQAQIAHLMQLPAYGCYRHITRMPVTNDVEQVVDNIWAIGGENGWYYADWLWRLRGLTDRIMGGVGRRRGRTLPNEIEPGAVLDFWRVLVASRSKRRLLLYAEMKLPGEGWLEFKITGKGSKLMYEQTAVFRPNGISGRLYWWAMMPFHFFIFRGMASQILSAKKRGASGLATGAGSDSSIK